MMKKVLITGFEPFGKYAENPTAKLCKDNNGKVIGDYKIQSEILDTIILSKIGSNHGEMIVNKIIEDDIDLVLSFGMSSDVDGLRIEKKGINYIDNLKYALPYEQGKKIVLGGDEELYINLLKSPIDKIINECKKNNLPIETVLSTDAGRFCCNALIYNILHNMKINNIAIPFLFFHCSCTSSAIKNILDFDQNKTIITDDELNSYLEIILSQY